MKSSVMIKPNNRTFILASLIFLLLAVHAQQAFSGVFQKTKDNELSPKQMITLQIIHQLSWSAQKIYTYNDKIALFEEQAALSGIG